MGKGKRNDICVEYKQIRNCVTFKYLSSIITDNGKLEKDVNNRNRMGEKARRALLEILWNKELKKETKSIFITVPCKG